MVHLQSALNIDQTNMELCNCASQIACFEGLCQDGFCAVEAVICPAGPGQRAWCDPESGGCVTEPDAEWKGCTVDADCRVVGLALSGLDACSIGYCDPLGTGNCVYISKPCNDRDPCTNDYCDPQTGCVFEPAFECAGCESNEACDDTDACTDDTCALGQCQHAAVPECQSCANASCEITGGSLNCQCLTLANEEPEACPPFICAGDFECTDELSCTLDICGPNGSCENVEVECIQTAPCGQTTGACVEGLGCEFFPNFGCNIACESHADCDTGSLCAIGTCAGGDCSVAPVECFDGKPCTFDVCNPESGECEYPAQPDCASGCDTASDCTPLELTACSHLFCGDGDCIQVPVVCDDHDPCTADACVDGVCGFAPIEACLGCLSAADCSDGDACTADLCGQDGDCTFESVPGCKPCQTLADCPLAQDACTQVLCDGGVCTSLLKANPCVVCDAGAGPSANAVICNDGDDCTTDTCNGDLQVCAWALDGTLVGCQPKPCTTNHNCDDLNTCTNDYCQLDDSGQGFCQAVDLFDVGLIDACPVACTVDLDCFDDNACTLDRCDPLNNTCEWTVKDCVDGSFCTLDRQCDPAAGCIFTPTVDCEDACEDDSQCDTGDPCLVGTCDSFFKQCDVEPADCDDNNPCSMDFCNAGQCLSVNIQGCTPCLLDSDCESVWLLQGPPGCGGFLCDEGSCVVVTGVNCDDSNPCTTDQCDPEQGCSFQPINGCTLGCTSNADCDDDDALTVDSCSDLGSCVNEYRQPCASDVDCYDTDGCTYEFCLGGFCRQKTALCFDALPCTKDLSPCGGQLSDIATEPAYQSCDPEEGQRPACESHVGCWHLPVLNCGASQETGPINCVSDADCDTGHPCWPGDCDAGTCSSGPVSCPDPGPNKQAYCDPQDGCVVVDMPGWTGCVEHEDCRHVDDEPRAGFDKCSIAFCNKGSEEPIKPCMAFAKPCDDLNPCTQDTCDPAEGCLFTPIPGCTGCSSNNDCDDTDPCTTDTCDDGCQHTAVPGCARCTTLTAADNCNDNNDCTQDLCDPAGASIVNEPGACFHAPVDPQIAPACGD